MTHSFQSQRDFQSALFVVNQSSGLGRGAAEIERLHQEFDRAFAFIPPRVVEIAATHEQARQFTRNFLTTHAAPYFLLAGGGAGTSRAMLQGVMELVAEKKIQLRDVYFSALRLGSGNVVPKMLGIPADPLAALCGIAQGLRNVQWRATSKWSGRSRLIKR